MLETTCYTVDDARKNRKPASYVQSIVVNGRNAGIAPTDHAQVLLAYEHLDSKLRLTLTEPTPYTTVAQFIEQLNSRKHAWFNIYGRNRGYTVMHERDRDQFGGNRQQGRQGFHQSNRFDTNQPPHSNFSPFPPCQPPPGNSALFQPQPPPIPNNTYPRFDAARPWINRDQQGQNQYQAFN